MNARTDSFAAALSGGSSQEDLRRAALLLHTVSAVDRSWLMAQLSADERATIEALLVELVDLGIPAAPELIEALGGGASLPITVDAASSTAGTSVAPLRACLAGADPAALARLLEGEPVGLIVRLLELGPWPWTGDLLARLGATQRRSVMDKLVAPAGAAGSRPHSLLDGRLLQIVEERLARAAGSHLSSRRPHGIAPRAPSAARGWLRRWISRDPRAAAGRVA